jgi:ATP-binding cassette subfamily B protein
LLRLLPYMKPYTGRIVFTWVCVFASGAFVMISPVLVRESVNQGLQPVRDNAGKIVGLNGNEQLLVFAALAIIVFAIARGIAAYGQTYLGEAIGQHVAYDIRNHIYNNIQRLSYAYHDQVETGQIMSRATQDVENIRMFFGQSLFRLGYVVVLVVVAIAGMFILNPTLALVSIITVPIISWRSVVMSRRMRPVWLQIQQSQAELTQVAEESLSGIRVVKAFSREPFESEKFRVAAQAQADLNYNQAKEMAKHTPLMQGLSMLQIAITVGVGSLLIARGELREGDLLAFVLWLNLLQLPVRTVGFLVNGVARCISSAERVFELIDAQSAVTEAPDARELTAAVGHVRFDDVSFGYDNVSPVLSGIDIDARPGQVIALLGPAGSGKSTVVNLIPRFYDVTAGRITIDGNDIRDVTLESLRRNIGIVQQDVFLFIGTIRDNIAYGKPGATQEEIERAAKAARIHDFIMSLPEGYNEWVGERGVTLSGGQKQRIAIARALAARPSLLVADEPISALDASTQTSVAGLMRDLVAEAGAGMLFISHDLAVVRRIADRTVVLYSGRVMESGATSRVWSSPQHPYTQALLAAIPEPDGAGRIPEAPSTDDRMLWSETPPVVD